MSEARYWNGVSDAWQATDRDHLWRGLSDALHLRLLRAWGLLPARGVVLKTDLFDEAATGRLGRALAAQASPLLGMDLSLRTVQAAARQAPQAALLVADVRALPLASGSVNTIISNSTLDHLSDVAQIHAALVELARVLADEGTLLVTLDNPQHPLLWLRQRLPWKVLHGLGLVPYRLGPTLSLAELSAACRSAGLTVAQTGAIVHGPRVLAVQVGRLLHRVGVRASPAYERAFAAWEGLARWPTRLATGRFVAVLALKAPAGLPREA